MMGLMNHSKIMVFGDIFFSDHFLAQGREGIGHEVEPGLITELCNQVVILSRQMDQLTAYIGFFEG